MTCDCQAKFDAAKKRWDDYLRARCGISASDRSKMNNELSDIYERHRKYECGRSYQEGEST